MMRGNNKNNHQVFELGMDMVLTHTEWRRRSLSILHAGLIAALSLYPLLSPLSPFIPGSNGLSH